MGPPKISVALCTFNGEQYIEAQLASILSQTITPYELIISDDNSKDSTLELIKTCCKRANFPIQILCNKTNVGIKANFENAISACTGDYVSLADQDDVWQSNKLEIFSKAIVESDRSSPTLFYSDPDLIDSSGEPTGHTFLSKARTTPPAQDHYRLLAIGNFAPGCSTVFDRQLVETILPIPAGAILHDWWINLIFSMCGKIERVQGATMSYRIHSGNNQGISSKARALEIGRKLGFISTACANLLATLDQVDSATERLSKRGQGCPSEIDRLMAVFQRKRVMRPVLLLRLGISRGHWLKTAVTLIASIFVDSTKIGKNSSRYT